MFAHFLPKEVNFFDLFDRQVDHAVSAATYFKELATNGSINEATAKRMHDIEHSGDEATHDIIDRLDKTFITPFDREDIHALAKELDDVIDMINTIVSRLKVYNLPSTDKNLAEFASIIEESVRAVACAVKGLRNLKHPEVITSSCVEINRLENVGDALRDKVLGELFANAKDPLDVIKWKEVYQDAETVLDVCEDVANVVESIRVKQA